MKKSLYKIIICLLLSLLMCTTSVATAFCTADTNNQVSFDNIDDFRSQIIDIYENNYDELIKIAKTLDNISVPDEHITYDSNCGPCSVAFQNILYKNNILVEVVERTLVRTHAFNLYRTTLSQSPDKISLIVVDTTYKQFIVDEYSSQGLNIEDMAKDIPQVLVYEYGDYDALDEQLKDMKNSLPQDKYERACKEVFDNHTKYEYIAQDFQDLPHKEMTTYDNKLLDDLRNSSGPTDKKFEDSVMLSSTTTDFKLPFGFDCNGIYRCFVPFDDVYKISGGFVITNKNGNTIFGSDIENDALSIANTNTFVDHDNDLKILKSNGKLPVSINTQNLFLPLLISIDLRAGEGRVALYAHPVGRVAQYGDVNSDGKVSILDATKLQMTIAKIEGYSLDMYETETANVLKTTPEDIMNATEICRYLAKYESEKCGQELFFSSAFRIGHSDHLGYIDMPTNK